MVCLKIYQFVTCGKCELKVEHSPSMVSFNVWFELLVMCFAVPCVVDDDLVVIRCPDLQEGTFGYLATDDDVLHSCRRNVKKRHETLLPVKSIPQTFVSNLGLNITAITGTSKG